jgi:flagellar basal-body rod protein FlgC
MDVFSAMETLASGLTAERVRMNITASNLANAQTTRTESGEAYRRRDVVLEAINLQDNGGFASALEREVAGVQVAKIVEDEDPFRRVYDPAHPDAAEDGYVNMPNVNMVEEMVGMVMASRAYEAGVTAMQSVRDMASKALSLGR